MTPFINLIKCVCTRGEIKGDDEGYVTLFFFFVIF